LVNLTSLDLIQNSFGNMPKEISGLVNLTYLQLDDKSFSEIEIREIRNLLPNCEIIFSDFWRS
jgi:Leucine-rich repeat (LRR) protein